MTPPPRTAGSTHLALTVVVQFDGIFLQLRHQVIGGHKPAQTNGSHETPSDGGSAPWSQGLSEVSASWRKQLLLHRRCQDCSEMWIRTRQVFGLADLKR